MPAFTFFGSNMQASGDIQKEINSQILKAAAAFNSLKKIYSLKNSNLRSKLWFFNWNAISTLGYWYESLKSSKGADRCLIALKANASGEY